jgi:hypothetical protein
MKKDQTIGNNQTWEILTMSINCWRLGNRCSPGNADNADRPA